MPSLLPSFVDRVVKASTAFSARFVQPYPQLSKQVRQGKLLLITHSEGDLLDQCGRDPEFY
jgi:hypothetical protein